MVEMNSTCTTLRKMIIPFLGLFVGILLTSSSLKLAQESASSQGSADSGSATADAPQKIDLSDLPQLTSAQIAAFKAAPRPQNGLTDKQWQALKARAAQMPALSRPRNNAQQPPQAPRRSGSGVFTPGASVSFAGENENCSGVTPSDMGLAVSGQWVLQVVNECVNVYTKAGVLQGGFPKSLNTFMGWGAGASTFDPRATFDYVRGRFVIIATTIAGNNGYIDVAASATSDPRGAYHVYHLSVWGAGNFPDYPTLGQNFATDKFVGGIYTCANIFPIAGGGFLTAYCLYLPKTQIYAGAAFGFNFNFNFSAGGNLVDSIQPSNVYDIGSKPRTEFMINSFNINFGGGQCATGCNGLVVWSVANGLQQAGSPGPSVSGFVVGTPSTYSLSANADNAGFCNNCIETIDTRLTGMVQYSAGHLFTTLDTGNGGTSAVLAWDVQPFIDDNGGGCGGAFVNACPLLSNVVINREFCYFCGAGHGGAAFFGTIAATQENNWTMVANFSNQVTSPGTFYTSNRVTWQQPFHDGGIFLAQNNAAYNQGRWGDYTAAAPDVGSSTPSLWFSGMFVNAAGNWSTQIGSNKFNTVKDP